MLNFYLPLKKIPLLKKGEIKRLKKLEIENLKDLLYYFPHRYEDFSKKVEIEKVNEEEKVTIQGWITKIQPKINKNGKIFLLEAQIEDGTGKIKAVWYNQPFLTQTLKRGKYFSFAGKVLKKNGEIFLSNPQFEPVLDFSQELLHTGRLVPIYSETKGITSKWIRKIIKRFLENLKEKFEEFLPEELIQRHKLMKFQDAIFQIHFPENERLARLARERFAFEEMFIIQLKMLFERMKFKSKKAFAIPINLEKIREFIKSLPFELTSAQKKTIYQILKDMEKEKPMGRLLQGDVGSGKTIVALVCAFNAAISGFQSAFLVPTEILAKQHFKNISRFLEKFNIKVGILTRKEKVNLKEIENGEIKILIGTHSLLEEKIKFKNLAFVILDEQHRFGVKQRAKLISKNTQNYSPHFLSMTATPIPRTLALTLYGDLDFSVLDELPKGREKVEIKVFQPTEISKMHGLIREEIKNGGQVFFVCPRIEMREKGRIIPFLRAVEEEYKKLIRIFPDFRIKMLHGKMKEKEKIMEQFEEGKIDILVATNVIEEGIDVAGATLMVIENAERFGLAQLYQLKGRVGRGEKKGKCFLITHFPTKKSAERLEALLNSENSLQLAQKDLEIRGPGDFFGEKQSGFLKLKVASLADIDLIQKARDFAKEILKRDPSLKNYPILKTEIQRFTPIHLE